MSDSARCAYPWRLFRRQILTPTTFRRDVECGRSLGAFLPVLARCVPRAVKIALLDCGRHFVRAFQLVDVSAELRPAGFKITDDLFEFACLEALLKAER